MCWSPALGDAGFSVDLVQAMAIAQGASQRMYAVDSAGNFKQAIYGVTVPTCPRASFGEAHAGCGTAPGGVVYFGQDPVIGTRAATVAGSRFTLPSIVKGVASSGNLVLDNATVFTPSTGNTQSLATASTAVSVSGEHAVVRKAGLFTLVNTVTLTSWPISSSRMVQLSPTLVLLEVTENYAKLDSTTGIRSPGFSWLSGLPLAPNGAIVLGGGSNCEPHWITSTGSATSAGSNCAGWVRAEGDWAFSGSREFQADGNFVHNRNSGMTREVLASVTVDDASIRAGVLLFSGVEQGIPAFGKVELVTGVVTRWTPPERILRVWHMQP